MYVERGMERKRENLLNFKSNNFHIYLHKTFLFQRGPY